MSGYTVIDQIWQMSLRAYCDNFFSYQSELVPGAFYEIMSWCTCSRIMTDAGNDAFAPYPPGTSGVTAMSTSAAIIELNVPIAMRDGVKLYADIFRPNTDGECPVILQRTPYGKRSEPALSTLLAVENGYAVVLQDVRGRYASEGNFDTFVNEAHDGYGTVEWIAEQAWSNGKIGMIGGSYAGAIQWLSASEKPPHLTAIFPSVTTSEYHEGWTYQGGVFQLGFNTSSGIRLAAAGANHLSEGLGFPDERVTQLTSAVDNIAEEFWTLPLDQQHHISALTSPYFFDWLNHPMEDGFWSSIRIEDKHDDIQTPAYNLGG